MESIRLGTAHLTDKALVEEFESCRLPTAQFHHADHIRLAWVLLRHLAEAEATERIARAIRRYAEHNKIAHLYHQTITLAWMKLVSAGVKATPAGTGFSDFAAVHPELFDVQLLRRYYSKDLLDSPLARAGWVEPDLRDLP